ncbi:MAG: sulfatase-like hydrolase/transferase [Anaerolineaceae bacterium]|nr:sulfatase-like hydrolase/transferase [Anaerolineaceae bacterium]
MRKIFRFPFFGILAGLFPIIALWNFNKSQIYPRDAVFSILVTLGFVAVVWGLAFSIFRSSIRSSIASSLFFLLFFSFGHIYNLIEDKTIFRFSIGFVKLLIVYLILLIIFFVIMIKVKSLSKDTVLLLNGLLALLIVVNLIQIAVYESARRKSAQPVENVAAAASDSTVQPADQQLADIYYIILDAYSRQDVLMEKMGYDNSGFISALEKRGFYVADCSNSNYAGTKNSVTSSLNYAYLDQVLDEEDGEGEIPQELLNNRIRLDLYRYGYKFVSTRAFSSETDINNADIYLNVTTDKGMKDTVAQSQFARLYFETTLLRPLFELYKMNPVQFDFIPDWFFLSDSRESAIGYASYWYMQTNYVLDSLEEFPTREGNYFVYAHINAPHGPYVYDANGNFRYTYNPETAEGNIPPYLDMVSYINKRVLQLVDILIAKSDEPPIIIIQGDHGAHMITTGLDKHKILNAFYLPADVQKDLYETITPVNTFRLILRDYFKEDIELLPDILYAKILNDLEPVPSTCPVPTK